MSSMKLILFSGISGRFNNNLCSHQRLSVIGNTTFVMQGIAQSILSMQRIRTGSVNSVNLENSFLINFKSNFVLTGRTYTAQQRSMFIWEIPVCVCVCVCELLSHVQLFATPQTAAHQAPPSIGSSRQEHWSGLLFPSPKGTMERKRWRSVMSDSLQPHGLQPTRLLHPLNFPGKGTGMGCHFLLHTYTWLPLNILLH